MLISLAEVAAILKRDWEKRKAEPVFPLSEIVADLRDKSERLSAAVSNPTADDIDLAAGCWLHHRDVLATIDEAGGPFLDRMEAVKAFEVTFKRAVHLLRVFGDREGMDAAGLSHAMQVIIRRRIRHREKLTAEELATIEAGTDVLHGIVVRSDNRKVAGRGKAKAASVKSRSGGLTKTQQAVATAIMIKRDNPTRSDRSIAAEVEIHPSALSRSPDYQRVLDLLAEDGPSKGFIKQLDDGSHDIEAYE